MKSQINKIKEESLNLINTKKEQFSKTFDFAKIRSNKLKDKINLSIRNKAIIAARAKLAINHKTFEDYNVEELEIIILHEERKIIDELKSKPLIAVLVILGLDSLL